MDLTQRGQRTVKLCTTRIMANEVFIPKFKAALAADDYDEIQGFLPSGTTEWDTLADDLKEIKLPELKQDTKYLLTEFESQNKGLAVMRDYVRCLLENNDHEGLHRYYHGPGAGVPLGWTKVEE